MNRTIFGIRLVCALAACSLAAPAFAQQQPQGNPFGGLFGRPRSQGQTLELSASAFAVADDNLLNSAPGGIGADPLLFSGRHLDSGIGTGFNSGLSYSYSRAGNRSNFTLGASAGLQEFSSSGRTDAFWVPSSGVNLGLAANLTTRTTLTLGAGANYSPYYQYVPFLRDTIAETTPVAGDFGFTTRSDFVLGLDASAGLSNQFSKRSSISGNVSVATRRIPTTNADLTTRSVGATFTHNITRKLNFHLGYSIYETKYSTEGTEPYRSQGIDIGLGYGDGLTFTIARKYQVSLSFGATIAKNGDPKSVLATGKNSALAYNAAATLSRSLGRTWSTSIGYNRGTYYIVGYQDPMTGESANAGVGGPLFGRVSFSAGVGASRGQRLFASTSGGDLVSYNATTRLTTQLWRRLSLYGQASYFRYDIPADFNFDPLTPTLNRRSASVGLSTAVPLIKPRRSTRDSG